MKEAIQPIYNNSTQDALQECIDAVRLQNGVPMINHPSLEKVWDFMLTGGKRIYGVASDDAHAYQELSPKLSNPGRGWVVVRATQLDRDEIMQNLDADLFYSSTGVEIADLKIYPTQIDIVIAEKYHTQHTTDFIGSKGKILYSTKKNPAVCELADESNYVRAKIQDSNGQCAWIQPVFLK